jgi:hypothetical protein
MPTVAHLIGPETPLDLLEQMWLLAGPGEAVVSIGPPPGGCPADRVKIAHRPLGCPGLAAMRLPAAARAADMLHAWGPSDSADLCGCEGRRLVLSMSCAPPRALVDRLIVRMRAGELVLTVPTAAALRAFLDAGAPSRGAWVLPPAAPSIPDADEKRARVRRELGVGERHVLLVAPGEMGRVAGHKYAPWVHAVLRQIRPDLRLLLPGLGEAEERARFYVGSAGLGDEVFLTSGRYSTAEALAAADLAVFFHERDCGVAAAAQAMAAGLPIVASRTPDLCELLEPGRAGILVPPRDPREASAGVLRVLDDPEWARRLGGRARQIARESHDPRRCRSRLEEVYASAGSAWRAEARQQSA